MISSEGAAQANATGKEKDTVDKTALETTKLPAAPKDSSKEKGISQSQKIVLVTVPIPTKEDSKCKDSAFSTTTPEKTAKDLAKDNPPPKNKWCPRYIL